MPTTPPLRIRSAPPLTQGRQGEVGACSLCTTLPERQGAVGACPLCTTLPGGKEVEGCSFPRPKRREFTGGTWFRPSDRARPAMRCRPAFPQKRPRSGGSRFISFPLPFSPALRLFPAKQVLRGPFAFDRLGRRKNRLPAALRRTRGAGSRLISFLLPFSPAPRLPAPGRPPCPPASWAGNRGTRCRRGGRIWRCSFCSNPAGSAGFPPRAARRA